MSESPTGICAAWDAWMHKAQHLIEEAIAQVPNMQPAPEGCVWVLSVVVTGEDWKADLALLSLDELATGARKLVAAVARRCTTGWPVVSAVIEGDKVYSEITEFTATPRAPHEPAPR